MARIGSDALYLDIGALDADEMSRATLVARGLHASSRFNPYENHSTGGNLVGYFAHLERNWRGWQGEETWQVMEGEFRIRATHTGSHVCLAVEIRDHAFTGGLPWAAQLEVVVDAGEQLSQALLDLRETFPNA